MITTMFFLTMFVNMPAHAVNKVKNTNKKQVREAMSVKNVAAVKKNQKSLVVRLIEIIFSNILPPVSMKTIKPLKNPLQAELKPLSKKRINKFGPKLVNNAKKSSKPARPAVMEGVDYSWGYYSGFAGKLKTPNKKHFVMRYAYTGEGKAITVSEVKELKKEGLGVGIVFEITRDHARPLSGYSAGKADARSARQYIHDVGLPSSMPIYFAVDFEANNAQQTMINRYLKGASSVLGKDKVGVYGGYNTVARALNAKVCKYAWQTYSWSYGKWDKRAQIRQYSNGLKINGVNIDLDKTVHSDNGVRFLR